MGNNEAEAITTELPGIWKRILTKCYILDNTGFKILKNTLWEKCNYLPEHMRK